MYIKGKIEIDVNSIFIRLQKSRKTLFLKSKASITTQSNFTVTRFSLDANGGVMRDERRTRRGENVE